MRIGVALELHGPRPGEGGEAARWRDIRNSALEAEAAGFDLVVVEDVFLGETAGEPTGAWESVAMLGAIAAGTTSIGIGHSMVNAPYRPAALVASVASTLDEISGGRYVLGLGAGNTSDDDYAALGVAADRRYSRFEESLTIIHEVLRGDGSDFAGEFQRVSGARLPVRAAERGGPPIVVGARGPRMMRLAARFADEWNANAYVPQTVEAFRPMVAELERACEAVGRDPATLGRSIDVVLNAADVVEGARASELAPYLVGGSREAIAETLAGFGELGMTEARCYLSPPVPAAQRGEAIGSMSDIVELVHGA